MKLKAVAILVGVWPFILQGAGFAQATAEPIPSRSASDIQAIADSVWAKYTLDDLIEFQEYYDQHTTELLTETDKLRQRGIRDMEAFLRGHPNSPILDKVMIRLAHMYYQQAVQDFGIANETYSQQLALYESGNLPEAPKEPVKDYSRALTLYDRIIDEFPESTLVDDAMYSKGFLLEDLGETQVAFEVFDDLIERYPDSNYSPIAYMRMAEYYFNPPVNDIEKAIELYKEVLRYKDSSKYDAALYRLGWAHYKLSDYPAAISYFTVLADDIDHARQLDPENKYHFPAVRDEAIEYIGISFLDYGGANRAAEYFTEIGGRQYGFDVLKKIGDSYMDVKEEYENAIRTYQIILSMYPESSAAPKIQAKIAEGYRQLEDERMAYVRRAELFRNYRADSEWWKKTDDLAARNEANELAERAIRDNINLLLKRANETEDENLYFQAINDSRDYLTAFPKDSNAVLIHWNMALTLDTKLKMHDEAYDEYLKISNLYWGTRFQKQAAENAIAIADEALKQDSLRVQSPSLSAAIASDSLADSDSLARVFDLDPEELTPAELRVVDALNNYVKLFPHEPETAKMLSKAGAIYYDRRQFRESLKYFKTLVRHFPESNEANYARYITMESYFGKADFESTEIIAKKLREAGPEYADRANQRLSESIFLRAKALADSSQHVRAAEEYRRMVREVPTAEFADLALYNAALEYEQANQYVLAIDSYNQLLDNYPKSDNYLDALNNLAFDYREIGDHHNAALTYERLADLHPKENEAQIALYNASVSFVQAKEWTSAINANSKYVERFPEAEDADELLFNNAQYYIRLNDIENANNIYEEFTRKFPDSPKVVEAHFHRGIYYKKNANLEQAKTEFDQAIHRNDDLKRKNLEANDFFAAEALFQLAEIKFDEFQQIKFKLPAVSLAASKDRKKALLLELVDNYTRTAGYGTFRLYQSTYRVGNCYEEFAATWADQEIPTLDENQRILALKDVNNTAADLYEKAVDSYKSAVKALQKFSENYKKSLSEQASPDTTVSREVKLTAVDTTMAAGEQWIARSKSKISENLYQIAELKLESVNVLLNSPAPPGIQKLEELVYRNQLMAKAVRPILREAVEAHIRNVTEARDLGLQNEWVEKSQDKVVSSSNIIPNEFQRLGSEALTGYKSMVQPYTTLIAQNDEDAFDYADQMSNFLELSKSFTLAACKEFAENIKKFRELELETPAVVATEDRLLQLNYEFYVATDSLSRKANAQRAHYENLFKETKVTVYEDAFLTFDDAYYFLNNASTEVLKAGYETSSELAIVNDWSKKIIFALVRLQPEEFAGELGLAIASRQIGTASDWLTAKKYTQGWTETNFADTSWTAASEESLTVQLDGAVANSIWFGSRRPTGIDSLRQTTQENGYVNQLRARRVFFRKSFDVEGLPVSGILKLLVDDSYNLFLNGTYIAQFQHNAAQEAQVQVHDLTEFLSSGKNTLAIEVVDTDNSHGRLEAILEVKNIPDWYRVQQSNNSTDGRDSGEAKIVETKKEQ